MEFKVFFKAYENGNLVFDDDVVLNCGFDDIQDTLDVMMDDGFDHVIFMVIDEDGNQYIF